MEAARHPWPVLGVLLVRDGLISKNELESILEEQRDVRHQRISGHQLGELLVTRGTVTPTQIAKLVAEQYELPFTELEMTDIDLRVARLLDEEITRRLSAVPISASTDGAYLLAIADPATVLFSDELRLALGTSTTFTVVGPEAIDAAIAFVHDRPYVLPAAIDSPDDDDQRGVVIELRSDESTRMGSSYDDSDAESRRAVPHRQPPLGALLLREGLVTDEELDRALTQQSLSTSWRLGEILVDLGIVTPAVVARLIAEQYELPYVELADLHIDPTVIALLPREIARNFPAAPIAAHPDGSVEIAIADPTNVYYSDELHTALGVPLTFVVAAPDAIEALLETLQAPGAVVELVRDEEHDQPESVATLDRANSKVEDAEEVVSDHHLPEFGVDTLADEEPVAIEQVAATEAQTSDEGSVEFLPTKAADLQHSDDATERDGTEDDPDDELGQMDIVADDLAAVLFAEVGEGHEPPDVPSEADVQQEPTLDLAEYEYAERLAETIGETTDPEAKGTPAEVEIFQDATENDVSYDHDELAVEDPAAYADDLDAAIEEVLALGASAIHFSPQGEWHTVRARIDGLVRELGVVAKADLESLVERVEASTAMRMNVLATKQGDKVTLFPREQAGSPRTLAELGLTSEAAAAVDAALTAPSGAIIVCGPIGAGTTTTLYAALEELKAPDRVITSIEDPVERVLDGIDQTEVDTRAGITFAGGLRTLLATDTDVVLVGDIRDHETAEVAFQAALDGRHVLSAVHAPSTAAAIRRLTDLGLDPGVLGGALTCVVAQRLVRRVCSDCRETYYASETELADLEQPIEGSGPRLLARGRGCKACDGTGFRGRLGIFEVLTVTDEIRTHVYDGASAKKIQRAAVAMGMRTLREDGVRLCLEGVTTAAEVQRILGTDR